MRAAATLAGTIIASGLYLAAAATFTLSPSWIGIGILGIAVTGAVAITMAMSPSIPIGGGART